MKTMFGFLLWGVLSTVQAAGFYELDYDWNKPGKQATTMVVGASAGSFAPMLVMDSTGYYEGFVGYPTKLGMVSIMPYFGLEGLKGVNPRARGLLLTSAQLRSVNMLVVNEFGGVTGNFHKERLWIDVGPYSLGFVRHSSAGFGSRVDYRLADGTTIYLQYLQRDSSSRMTLAVSGAF